VNPTSFCSQKLSQVTGLERGQVSKKTKSLQRFRRHLRFIEKHRGKAGFANCVVRPVYTPVPSHRLTSNCMALVSDLDLDLWNDLDLVSNDLDLLLAKNKHVLCHNCAKKSVLFWRQTPSCPCDLDLVQWPWPSFAWPWPNLLWHWHWPWPSMTLTFVGVNWRYMRSKGSLCQKIGPILNAPPVTLWPWPR
jgi:hypothetical protein